MSTTESPSAMLRVTGLRKSFDELVAVDDLSFNIETGETFGLLGPNGAGKTTSISMVCGLLDPDAGAITVDGVPIEADSTRGRELIGLVPQELALYTDMNGWTIWRSSPGCTGSGGRRPKPGSKRYCRSSASQIVPGTRSRNTPVACSGG